MFNEEGVDFSFGSFSSKSPPEGALETSVSENYDKISGWLQRKPIHGVKSWEWRYFILLDCKLKYYTTQSSIYPCGVFNFNQLTATIASLKKRCFLIEFHSCSHRFIYRAQTKEERQMWLTVLNFHIMSSLGSDQILTTVARKEDFWKMERVSDYWFQNNAATGDILLFQAKAMGAKIQRGIARSSFDHVAMLLCYSSGKIAVFEATAANGVALVDWDEFFSQNWISFYTKIMYRRLEVERTDYLLIDLEKFINKTKGKSFGFSAKKMILGQNKRAGHENDFFCSELIASAYKAIGIMRNEADTSAIWPMHFEKEDGLELVGASLGPLMQIDFDL